MHPQLPVSIVGGAGFALGALASYFDFRPTARWPAVLLRLTALIAVAANTLYLVGLMRAQGTVETFQQDHNATLLLASLIALTALGTHVTSSLRGLDGLLFLVAAVMSFSSIAVIGQPGSGISFKPWFITHTFAFILSGVCFVTGGVGGVAYLLVHRSLRRKRTLNLVKRVAPLESLERFVRWMLMIGFPLFTYGILTGICELVRTHNPGPGAWLADPLILLSFMAWFGYALMVAALLFVPWIRGRRAAAMATCGMALIVVIFLVIEVVSPLHG